MKSKYLPLVLIISLLHSCEFIKLKSGEEANVQEIPVARVFDTYLYKADLTEFEKYEIGRRLNKEVSEQEIQTYYDDKFENFLLKQNIIKCLFVKIPKEAPRISRIRGLLRSYPDSDMEEIKSYCFRFAISSSLEDNAWLNFDEVVKSTPLATIPNKVQFLRDNSFVESSDDKFIYFIKLLEYKISDQVSPLEFIREDIVNIILNKRKIELAKKLEEEIINEAQQNDEFEIYRN